MRHAVSRSLIGLADPLGSPVAAGRMPTLRLGMLLEQAAAHGVLPAVLRRLAWPRDDRALTEIRARHQDSLAVGAAFSLLLRHQGGLVLDRLRAEGIPALIVKGATFARLIYPDPALRPFTDIDIVLPPAALAKAEAVLSGLGFRLGDGQRAAEQMERKWFHAAQPNVMVELQGNLVHSPRLRAALSLGYDELVPSGDPAEAEHPAALLAIAAVHAACGHHFEHLKQSVDVLQAARAVRTAADEEALEALAGRTGARFALVAALDLAGRLFGEIRCRELAEGLGPVRSARAARWLISGQVVTAMTTSRRWAYSWRRSLFRRLIARPAERLAT